MAGRQSIGPPPPPTEITIHGVFLAVESVGVLLTGPAGIGKSELALELIDRGHRLVADDAPLFRTDDASVIGRCPPILQDLLEIRGLGVLDVRRLFGESAIVSAHPLDLIVDLLPGEAVPPRRLHPRMDTRDVLGHEIPRLSLSPRPGRNLAILVETSIRNHLLQRSGYNPVADLEQRLRRRFDSFARRGDPETR